MMAATAAKKHDTEDNAIVAGAVLVAAYLAWLLWQKKKAAGYPGGGSFTGPSGALDRFGRPQQSQGPTFKFPSLGGGPPSHNVGTKPKLKSGLGKSKTQVPTVYDAMTATIPYEDLPVYPTDGYVLQSPGDNLAAWDLTDGEFNSNLYASEEYTPLPDSASPEQSVPDAGGHSDVQGFDDQGNVIYDSTQGSDSQDNTQGSIDSSWDQNPTDGGDSWYTGGSGYAGWWDDGSGGYGGGDYGGYGGGDYGGYGGGDYGGGGGGGGAGGGDGGGEGGVYESPGADGL